MNVRRIASPHHPDSLVNELGKRVQAAISPAGWRLGAMTVCAGGELRLFVVPADRGAESGVELSWERRPPAGVPVAGFGGRVVALTDEGRHSEAKIEELAALAAGTFSALPTADFELLAFAPDDTRDIPFDKSITSCLFGGWLVTAKTRWRGYTCAEMSQAFSPPSISILFEGEGGALNVELTPRLDRSVAHRRPGSSPFGAAITDGSGNQVAARPGGPGAYVMFLVSRRLGPRTQIVEVPGTAAATTGMRNTRPSPWEWGQKRGWRRFFHMDEITDLAEVRRVLVGPHAELVLGERECHNSHPCSYGPRLGAFDFPALEPWPDLYSGNLLASLVTERQLVAGPGNLFREMLDSAGGTPGCRATVVADTCVSSLLAEDADLLSEGLRRDGTAATAETGENLLLRNERFFEGLLTGRAPSQRTDDAPAINLVGYLPGPGRQELTHLLSQCGVQVNSFFFPDIHLLGLSDFANAACNVLYPVAHRTSAYAAIERASGLESLAPPPPHGWGATRRWLLYIAGLFDRTQQAEEVADLWFSNARERLERTRTRAEDNPVLFVASEVDLEFLLEPSRAMGVPMLETLEEMGFPIEILYYAGEQSEQGRADETRCRKLQRRRPRPCLGRFSQRPELARALLAGKARLVYSDSRCDYRVHRAGKNTFSLRHFEMGFEGALRTATRLLRRAANPYFARFAASDTGGEQS